ISGQRAAILADLAVAPIPVSSLTKDIVPAPARYGLPELPDYALALLLPEAQTGPIAAAADHLRASFAQV
ncbi:MAG: LysR family transcriptional regulator, partial [Alphaproteobacteria bacterium]|nr:LysR family transcriptional regulator [Alphaproteobacteria bacterium]